MMDWDEIAKPYESVRAEVLLQKSSKELIKDHNCANLIVPKKAVASPYPSPMEAILVHNRRVLVKRDDLLRLPGSNASGNKARKMLALSLISTDEFPDAVVSFGGPQSNAMVSLAAIVAAKNADIDPSSDERKRFIYYTKKLPRYLRKQPNGNLLRAKSLGMELIEMSHDEYRNIFGGPSGGSSQPPADLDPPILTNGGKSLWVPQGGAFEAAVLGIRSLAQEIVMFWEEDGEGALAVVVPSGTGTTAVLLQKEINHILNDKCLLPQIRVVAVPCVGDDEYLLRQMKSLDKVTGGNMKENIPDILRPLIGAQRKYFTFGEPHAVILDTYRNMKDRYGLHLDLIYGSPVWSIILPYLEMGDKIIDCPLSGKQIMYLHCGGLEGISSQLTRYKHKKMIMDDEVQ